MKDSVVIKIVISNFSISILVIFVNRILINLNDQKSSKQTARNFKPAQTIPGNDHAAAFICVIQQWRKPVITNDHGSWY